MCLSPIRSFFEPSNPPLGSNFNHYARNVFVPPPSSPHRLTAHATRCVKMRDVFDCAKLILISLVYGNCFNRNCHFACKFGHSSVWSQETVSTGIVSLLANLGTPFNQCAPTITPALSYNLRGAVRNNEGRV